MLWLPQDQSACIRMYFVLLPHIHMLVMNPYLTGVGSVRAEKSYRDGDKSG